MATLKQDLIFGTKQEIKQLKKITTFFNDNLRKSEKKYQRWDFEGDTHIYELKSRNNKLYHYPDTLIAEDKILSPKQLNGKKQIFLFNFTDGIYYIEYDKNVFKNIRCEMYVRNKRNDYNDIEKPYYFIEVWRLKPMMKISQEPNNQTLDELEAELSEPYIDEEEVEKQVIDALDIEFTSKYQ